VKIEAFSASSHMNANSILLASHYTIMTGTLYKPGTSNTDVFVSGIMQLNYRMISTANTYIVPPSTINDFIYIIKDPGVYHVLGSFNVNDLGGLLGVFELKQTNGLPFDTTIFTFVNPMLNPPQILINSTDNSKIGDYYFYIRAKFNGDFPYSIDSTMFRIRVLHQCVRNRITG
jgi:hypothetical protein